MVSKIESAVKGSKPICRYSATSLGKREKAGACGAPKGSFALKAT